MTIEAMKQALEALEILARYENPETRIQVRKPKDGGPIVTMYPHKVASDAAQFLRQAIANEALNRMAENEQDLGIQMKRCDCAAHSAVECVLLLMTPTHNQSVSR